MMMEKDDIGTYIDRYESRLKRYGHSPRTLGWGKQGRQEIRFGILAEEVLKQPESSVLDVGCGFADLYDFLTTRGWNGPYYGIDIVPGLIEVARRLHPDLDIHVCDITSDACPQDKFDYIICSGVFNAKLSRSCNKDHIRKALHRMFNLIRKCVCIDFMSTYVDYQHSGAWHTDPLWAFAVAKGLSRRVALRHDYMPYEFALFIYKDDSVSDRNVFNVIENGLASKNRHKLEKLP
jgi:SAM-dependent methyltransferase